MSYTSNFQTVLTCIDQTSSGFQSYGANVTSVNNKVNVLVDEQKKASVSAKDLTVSLSGMATAGFSLYLSFDRIEKSQVALDRANLNVKRSTETVDQATKNYNETVAKYGVGSAEAKDAADKLTIAQEALSVAQERADVAQGNVSQSMVSFALSVVPTMITMVSSASSAFKMMGVSISATNSALSVGLIGALIAIVAVLINAYNTCEPFRNAINGIGEAIINFGRAVYDFFKPAIDFVIGSFNTLLGAYTVVAGAITGFVNWVTGAGNAAEEVADKTDELSSSVDGVTGSFEAQIDVQNEYLRVARETQNIDPMVAAGIDRVTSSLEAQIDATNEYLRVARETQNLDPMVAAGIGLITEKLKENSKFTGILTQDYQKMRISTDTNLGEIKMAFDEAFNAGDIAAATQIIRDFADKYTISMDDAYKAIQNFEDAQKEVPKSIEEQLIGKAQADLEAFKTCSTGKFAEISAIGTDEMDVLVSDVNDLISKGLVGQAQDSIKAFQDCSTNKAADMAVSIKASMDEMVKNGIKSAEDMAKYATLSDWFEKLMNLANNAKTAINDVYKAGYGGGGAGGGGIFTRVTPLQEGAIVTRPTIAMVGEAGPEAVVPLGKMGRINVTGPLIVVEGSMDRKVADYAVARVQEALENVIVEPSSVNAGSTHKRIRFGNKMR